MAYMNFQVAAFKGLESYRLSGVTVTDEELGTGSYATVLKLDYLGLKCAGKRIHKILLGEEAGSMTYTVRRFKDECQILSQVRHPNIVQFLGVFFQQGDYIPILVMEYLPLNLDQCLEKHNLPNDVQCSILHDVAIGLHYLHSQQSPIVHRDLSSNNVLLTSNIRAKISDLGVARILNLSPQKVTHLTKAPGTPAFMPPEVMVANPKYDTSVDVFSYGILMIHILSGQMPIPHVESVRTEGDCLIPVSEAERRESFLEAIGKDHPLMELILKCIHNNPAMRTNTSEMVSQLADMMEQNPTQFTNQLDMTEYIDRLEEQSEELKREKLEYRNSQALEKAKQMKEVISKLEKKQEEDQLEVQMLLQKVDQATDSLKTSLTDEVRKVLNGRAQSTTRDLDELREELKRVESSAAASARPPAQRQRRAYENTLPIRQEKLELKHVQIASNTLPASVKHSTKTKAKKQEEVLQAKISPAICSRQERLRPRQEDQNAKIEEKEASKTWSGTATSDSETLLSEQMVQSNLEPHQRWTHRKSSSISNAEERVDGRTPSSQPRPKSVSVDSSTNDKLGLQHTQMSSSSMGIAEESVDTKSRSSHSRSKSESVDLPENDSSALKHPQKQVSKLPPLLKGKSQGPPPTPPKTRERKLTTSMSELDSFTREDTNSRGFTVSEVIEKSTCFMQEEDKTKKDKGCNRSTTDVTVCKVDVNPKKDTPLNKFKALKLRNIFSPKSKDKPSAAALTEPCESEELESSVYDTSLEDSKKISKALSTTDDDLMYPIYTAKFDYEATSPSELSFRKGDQMHIKSKGKGKMWLASHNGKEGTVPKSYVAALEDEEWFFGKMDSTMAKNFVMTSSNQVGSFLVRQNKDTGIFSVTIRDKEKPRHYHIHKQENGMFFISEQCSFRSISDLVQHHSKTASGLFTTLAKPCIVPHCITDRAEMTWDEKLASGQFSEVWKGQWKGDAVIISKVTPGSVSSLDLLDKCAFLKTLDHENLVQFCAMHISSEPFLVITECTVNGSLKEYLPSQFESKDFKMSELIKISEQVAAAMQYLEEQNCIHQDLAANNVMIEINNEETLTIQCKLSIYPYVHKLNEYGAYYDLPAGTIPIRWSSQEAILKNRINIKSNVWSFGIFIWEIIHYCTRYPYPETSEAGVLEKLKQGYRMPRPLGCPEELYSLLCDCWKEDPSCRPTFETLHWQLRDFYTSDSFGYQQVELIK